MQPHDLVERMIDHFQAGGVIMIPLVILSVLIWIHSLGKSIVFLRERRRETTPEQCLDMVDKITGDCCGRMASWQRDILSGYLSQRCREPALDREILEAARLRQEAKAMRNIRSILVMAAIAPLLGLLGTVTGMITTFDVIAEFGTGNARALASGISEALVTTQSGLVVAVPGLILGTLLLRYATTLKHRMEIFCIGLQQADNGDPEGALP